MFDIYIYIQCQPGCPSLWEVAWREVITTTTDGNGKDVQRKARRADDTHGRRRIDEFGVGVRRIMMKGLPCRHHHRARFREISGETRRSSNVGVITRGWWRARVVFIYITRGSPSRTAYRMYYPNKTDEKNEETRGVQVLTRENSAMHGSMPMHTYALTLLHEKDDLHRIQWVFDGHAHSTALFEKKETHGRSRNRYCMYRIEERYESPDENTRGTHHDHNVLF